MKKTDIDNSLFDYSISFAADKSQKVIMIKSITTVNGELIKYEYTTTWSEHYKNILNSSSLLTPQILFGALLLPNNFENQFIRILLLKKALTQGIDFNLQLGREDITLLHRACLWNYYDITKILLKNGANPNIKNKYGNTPLHLIAKNNFIKTTLDLAKLLLDYSAKTELTDAFGWYPIQSATDKGHTELVRLLLQYGANINVIVTTGYYFAGKSLIELVPKNKPELKILLQLTQAWINNDFSRLDDSSVIVNNIKEFLDWQILIKPEYNDINTAARFKYSHKLQNFKKFLEEKPELFNQEIQKLNDISNSYISLKNLAISNIIKNPHLYKPNILPHDLEDQLKDYGLELTGDVYTRLIFLVSGCKKRG